MTVPPKNNVQPTAFSISYDGKDTIYDRHMISASELAEIISSVNDLVVESHYILSPDKLKKEVTTSFLTVTAPIKKGSIIIDFLVNLEGWVAVAQAIGIVSGAAIGAGSVFELTKIRGNKKPEEIEIDEEADKATIIDSDGKQYETSIPVAKLINSSKVRSSLQKIVYKPGQKPNAVVSILNQKGNPITTVDSTTVGSYKLDQENESTQKERKETTIKFSKINLNGDTGWTFYFPNSPGRIRRVEIEDNKFLSRVQNSTIKFDSSVLFVVDLETIVKREKSGSTSTKFVIKKVLKQLGG